MKVDQTAADHLFGAARPKAAGAVGVVFANTDEELFVIGGGGRPQTPF